MIGLIFYYLLVLLVFLAGLVCAFFALVTALSAQSHSLGVFLIAAIVSFMAARNLMRGVLASRRERAENAQLKRENAERPWRWRVDWVAGKVVFSGLETVRASWGLTCLWFFVFTPVVLLIPHAIEKHGQRLLFYGLYGLAGAGALFFFCWAIRSTHRWKKFKCSVFEMSSFPFRTGGHMAGVLRLEKHLVPENGFDVALRCLQITRGSGEHARVRVHVLSEDTHTVLNQLDDSEPGASAIPVFFQIPAEQPESKSKEYHESIVWQLQVSARVPGSDYEALFTVPVYNTPDNEDMLSEPPWKYEKRERDSRQKLEEIGIFIRPASGDSTKVVFPAGRNPVAIIKQWALTFALGALSVLFFLPGESKLAFAGGIVLVGGVLLNAWFALRLWLLKSTFRLGKRHVELATWMFGPSRKRVEIPAEDVRDFVVRNGWEHKSRNYYDIKMEYIVRKEGESGGVPRSMTIGRGIPCRQDAEWLASEMKQRD